jgi:hypothetical protein
MTVRVLRVARPAAAVAAALVLAGCGGSGSSTPNAGTGGSSAPGSGSGSTSSSGPGQGGGSTPSQVKGVKLTAQGTQLGLGQTAKVTWQPAGKPVAAAAISVTKLEQVPISAFSSWRLSKATQRSTPYFVRATLRNLGTSDLSGVTVPLYLLDRSNTLLQPSTFQASYPRCPSQPLPQHFTHGKKTSVCLVYFVTHHGKLQAVSFRPTGDFKAITWMGHVGHASH